MVAIICFEKLVDVFLVFGAIGTVGTFIVSFCSLKKQDKRISSIENAKFFPEIRINYSDGKVAENQQLSFCISNHGENLILLEFNCPAKYLDEQNAMLPYYLDSGKERLVYLSKELCVFPMDFEMKIKAQDKIGRFFWIPIKTKGKIPFVDRNGIKEVKS